MPPPPREGQSVNIQVEATITDQQPGSAPVKKSIWVVVGDSLNGGIRTAAEFTYPVPLNMDVQPVLLPDGKIRLRLALQYDLPSPAALGRTIQSSERQPQKTTISESLTVILESGKSLVVAQSADPISDRQVTLEVKATTLR